MKTTLTALGFLTAMVALSCNTNKNADRMVKKTEIRYIHDFRSRFVKPRNIEIWLPPGYDSTRAYPVLYVHDGQNIFNPETAYTKVDWGVDEWMDSLIRDQVVREAMVVGIWNTDLRFNEYMPDEEIGMEQLEEIRKFEGAEHNKKDWRDRLDVPLRFLLGKDE